MYYYDTAGRKIAEVSPNYGVKGAKFDYKNGTEYAYDSMGRLKTTKSIYFDTLTQKYKTIVTKTYDYDNNSNLKTETDALGNVTKTTYNLANKPLTVLDADTNDRGLPYTVSYTYDGAGRKKTETNAAGVVTKYYYDDANNILKTTVKKTASDVEQTIKSSAYDLLGNVTKQTDGMGNYTNYLYNAMNKVRQVTCSGDGSIDPYIVTNQYDVMGNLKQKSDSMGKINLYTYDYQGRVLSTLEKALDGKDPITTSVKYDVNGNKRYVTDGNGTKSTNIYDALNRLESTTITVKDVTDTVLVDQTTSFTYDANGNKKSEKYWRENITQYNYDDLDRLIETIDANGKTIQKLEYYDNGTQSNSYDALGHCTQYFYDKNKRLTSTIDPEKSTSTIESEKHKTSQTYDAVGNIDSKTDGNNNVTKYHFNEFNQMDKVTNAKNETTSYTYDLNGNMLSQTVGNNTTNYEYNAANKQVKRIDNGGRTGVAGSYAYTYSKVERYTYYPDGNLKTKTDKNGVGTTYLYDIHGRMTTETVGTVGVADTIKITYTYDANGNQLEITDSTGTTTRTYDELNRTTSKTVPNMGTTIYKYDIIEGIAGGSYGESTKIGTDNITLKVYDKTGRLQYVKVDTDTDVNRYIYDDNGNLKSLTNANDPNATIGSNGFGGSSENYTYYDDNSLKTLINKKRDGTIINSYFYIYDNAHNISSKVDTMDDKGVISYTYDKLNRLETITEATTNKTTKTTYVYYDGSGNRRTETIETVVNGIKSTTVTSYNYDSDQNKLMSSTTTVNGVKTQTMEYTYDNNGSQLTSIMTPYINGVAGTIQKTENSYDKLNQLTTTTIKNGTTLSNTIINNYNGEGMRVSKVSSGKMIYYLYEGDKVIFETDMGGAFVGRNVYGTNLICRTIADGTRGYYMYNGHADVTSIIGQDGKIKLASYYYDEFGNLTSSTGTFNNSNTYAGYQYDSETKTYYLMSRMYDPDTARFLQEDTYRGDPSDPLSLNLYTYCANNPIIYYDPTGHSLKDIWNGAKSAASATGSFLAAGVGGVFDSVVYEPMYYGLKAAGWAENKLTGTNICNESAKDLKDNYINPTLDFLNNVGGNEKAAKVGNFTGYVGGTILSLWEVPTLIKKIPTAMKNGVALIKNIPQIAENTSTAFKNIPSAIENMVSNGGKVVNVLKNAYNDGKVVELVTEAGNIKSGGYDFIEAANSFKTGIQNILSDSNKGSNVFKIVEKDISTAENLTKVVTGQIGYGSSDLSKIAIEYRKANDIYSARNISVFEYIDGEIAKTLAMASQRGVGHAERLVAKGLTNLGVDSSQVTRIYSELEPCSVPGGYCKRFLQNTFQQADVTYSFEYGISKLSRTNGIKALKEAIKSIIK